MTKYVHAENYPTSSTKYLLWSSGKCSCERGQANLTGICPTYLLGQLAHTYNVLRSFIPRPSTAPVFRVSVRLSAGPVPRVLIYFLTHFKESFASSPPAPARAPARSATLPALISVKMLLVVRSRHRSISIRRSPRRSLAGARCPRRQRRSRSQHAAGARNF